MKKIFIPQLDAFGGAERLVLSLSRYLHQKSVPHEVVCYRKNIDLQKYADAPISVRELLPQRSVFSKLSALAKFFSAERNTGEPILLIGIQAALHVSILALFGMTRKIPYHLMILDTPSLLTPPPRGLRAVISNALIGFGSRRATSVQAMTQAVTDEISLLYATRAAIIRPGVNLDPIQFRMRPALPGRPIRILSVCRLEASKRVDWIIRSLAELGLKSEWELDIVGSGSQQAELEKLANSLSLYSRVHFHGHVSDEQLNSIYDRAQLFVMPAKQGYGLPALEALARGIPVVMHRESGVSEILGETLWVDLIEGRQESLSRGLASALGKVANGTLDPSSLPQLPTDLSWADTTSKVTGWTRETTK